MVIVSGAVILLALKTCFKTRLICFDPSIVLVGLLLVKLSVQSIFACFALTDQSKNHVFTVRFLQSQEEATPCVVSKSNSVTTDSETHHPVVSSSTSKVTSLGAGSVKSAASRYIPVFSQLSLSRPQCSFVHIDGVQCGAITWNK